MKTPLKSKSAKNDGKTRPPAGKVKPEHVVGPVKSTASVEQSKSYERAMRHFHAMEFGPAKAQFERATDGPVREVAHAARLYAKMCEQRLAKAALALRDPEDYYNYAVTLINRRELDAAEEHLRRALSHNPGGDHIYYALALCRGLQGDYQGASAHLRRAIELEPRNRIVARNDPDFAEIGQHPTLRGLLF
jgi:tetratricopeptide (TPR) repeat protein